ncbi:hypothetical protein [Methylobacterium sp. J-076]|uniref:hypothetical protein n=1 Tax=Methylobacterium sp. J-076 TaxID=2836655 RepID=UPI001FB88C85|nr:hypothetical protein [Methylobacterium sp. J-076]MCJ2012661.1 hypothetical protein [Methylobacterium sp. J-076]
MASDIIKEFLVSIGFAVDSSSEQKMKRALKDQEDSLKNREKLEQEYDKKQKERTERATKAMRGLVTVASTAAVAIEGFTIAMAGYATLVAAKLEAMAYASERTRSSVQDLRVFSQAVSQLGGTAGGALSDLENFAARLRSNPQGYTAFLRSVGVEARDAKGNIRGATELYKEFRRSVGGKPYEQQLLYMQEMGVSEQTWRATDPSRMAGEEAAQRAKYARMGFNPDKAADDAKQLQHALRDMFDTINVIGEKAASKIFKDVGDNLKGFNTFLEQHGDQIAEILSKITQLVLGFSKALLELATSDKAKAFIDGLLSTFGHIDEATGKWVADTDKIKEALEALAVFVATVFVAKITGAFASVLKELKPLLVLLAPLFAALGIPILGTAAVGGALIGLGDPSKSLNGTGGRPDGQLNPGDELPGVGGGASGGGEGAWDRAKRLGRGALRALGIGKGTGVGHAASKEERAAYIREAAKRNGIDPETALRVAQSEGFNVYSGDPDASGAPTSFGDFQLHYPGRGRNTADGLGSKFTRETGLDARDPTTWKAQIDFAMKEAAKRGWGDWHGAARVGIGRMQGIGVGRIDADKARGIGAATQGFDPSQFLTAPPVGSTTNDNSVKQQSYKGGDMHVTINSHGDAAETAAIWQRHGERAKADDLRYAASMFA